LSSVLTEAFVVLVSVN